MAAALFFFAAAARVFSRLPPAPAPVPVLARSSSAPASASSARSVPHESPSSSAMFTSRHNAELSMSCPAPAGFPASSLARLAAAAGPSPRGGSRRADPARIAAAAASSRLGPVPGMSPSSDAHHGTSAAAVSKPPVARTAAHPSGFSFVRFVSTHTTARSVPAASLGSAPRPDAREVRTPRIVAPASVACVAVAAAAARPGSARRSECTRVQRAGREPPGGAPPAPSSSHAMDASTAAATREKLNVGVSASPPFTPRAPAGGGEDIASISTSSATELALALAFEFAASVSREFAASVPRPPALASRRSRGGFAPGDGVRRSASAVLNFFSIVASSSGSSSCARFDPAPAGDAGGVRWMPRTLTCPITPATSPASSSPGVAPGPFATPPPRPAGWPLGAGLAIASLVRIGTSAIFPRGGGRPRSPVTSADAHGVHPNVAASITREHRNNRAMARDARRASLASFASVPSVDGDAPVRIPTSRLVVSEPSSRSFGSGPGPGREKHASPRS